MWKKITDSKWFYIVVSLLLTFVLWLYVGKEANPSVAAPVRGIKVTVAGLEKLDYDGPFLYEPHANSPGRAVITPAMVAESRDRLLGEGV